MTRHADNKLMIFETCFLSLSVQSFACSLCVVSEVVKTNSAVSELYAVIFKKGLGYVE